jgi:50S ribosomal subunit-associated GTPase HflX
MDSTQARTPTGFIASLLLSLSAQFRFGLPQVNVLNKVDLLDGSVVERMLEWSEETDSLRQSLMGERGLEVELSIRLSEAIGAVGAVPRPIPVSARSGEGLDALYRVLHNIYMGGSDYDYVE